MVTVNKKVIPDIRVPKILTEKVVASTSLLNRWHNLVKFIAGNRSTQHVTAKVTLCSDWFILYLTKLQ